MELGHYQVFLSLVLILAGAFVALICDFLKGNNDRLRELALELQVRRQEDQKHLDMMAPLYAFAGPAPAVPTVASGAPIVDPLADNDPVDASAAAPPAVPAEPRATERERVEIILEPAVSTKKNWNALLTAPSRVREIASVAPAKSEATLPAGLQNPTVLKELIESGQRISGLVVSISVQAPTRMDGSLPAQVSDMIQSLLEPGDFAAQSGPTEFAMISTARGASAQRRLIQIGHQLWDYQSNPIAEGKIAFSWGGEDVRDESLKDAIAIAKERMLENKRGRNVLSMQPLRRVV